LREAPQSLVVDLAAGTGANRRWLDRHLPASTRWTLVDNDPAHVDGIPGARLLDLATALDELGNCDGATCSAFLDLVSSAWLDRFVVWLRGRPFLAALSVDGRVQFAPEHPDDARVLAAFAADQRRDKGFGPALGPDAPRHLVALLRDAGYCVETARSDWSLGASDGAMLAAMIDGFASIAPGALDWAAGRRRQASAGMLRLTIGHVDVLGWR
jgi:hypothetical protein